MPEKQALLGIDYLFLALLIEWHATLSLGCLSKVRCGGEWLIEVLAS
jgi:hypothetical protein